MSIPRPNTDAHGEVVNGPDTFAVVASELRGIGRCIIGWTDGEGTHYDVLFTRTPPQYGELRNGNCGPRDLFVSILGRAAFGFDQARIEPRLPSYVGEKLNEHRGLTADALTELLNGVTAALQRRGT